MYSSDLKQKARYDLAGKWGIAILAALIAGILGALLIASSVTFNLHLDERNLNFLTEKVVKFLSRLLTGAGFLGLVQFILGGTVQLGYSIFLLKMHDGQDASLDDLFSQFHRFGTGFCQAFLRGLYVFLWSLLFIIPGFIAIFKYAMTPFILAENPDMTASEGITASKYLMDGYKWNLFCLHLSFIGWVLLNILTLGIGSLWLNPYMNASYAAFYRTVCIRKQHNA